MTALRRVPVLLLVALAVASPAGASAPLPDRLAAVLAAARAETGAEVVDLATGRTLFAENDAVPLAPASNEKLALTYAALRTLGPWFRLHTDVLGEGRLVGGVWRGDLVLKGYGDPTLTHWGLRALAVRLRALGIRRVTGGLVADESYFDRERAGPGWKPSFASEESAPLSALTVDRDWYVDHTTRRPALAAALLFQRALARAGIRVDGRVRVLGAGGFPLASVYSPPLAEILRFMDTESDNFTAELLLKQLGAVLRGDGSTAAGASVVAETLAADGVPMTGIEIADGSGLSSLDRLTPRALASILELAWNDRELRAYLVDALAVAGRTGTLKHRLRRPPARGNVHAKTGTTDLASALSGYVRDRFAFVIVQNGHPVPYLAARAAQDRVAQLLAAQ